MNAIYNAVVLCPLVALVMVGADDLRLRATVRGNAKTSSTQAQTIAELKGAAAVQDARLRQLADEGAAAREAAETALAEARKASESRQAHINALQARILAARHNDCATAIRELKALKGAAR